MNTENDVILGFIDKILLDPTCRLDVTYWRDFSIDFNSNSKFKPMCLNELGDLKNEKLENQPILREDYYTFKVTYTGNVVLKEPVQYEDVGKNRKVVKTGDIVFSRINCCRGAIGIVKDYQDNAICTNETHIFTVTSPEVDSRYLHIILRHPYYQDKILSRCTGASLERKRFHEDELLNFEVPIPPHKKQLELINKVLEHDELIKRSNDRIEQLRVERNSYILKELGIELFFNQPNENMYALNVSDVLSNDYSRLDFEHNRPSLSKMINKINLCTHPIKKISDIISHKIESGQSPEGGIYSTKGIIFLRGGNIAENGIDLSSHEYITPEFHEKLKRSQLKGNEVLVTIAGTIGKTGFNDKISNANVNQAIAILRLKNGVLPLYVSSFLNSDGGLIQFAKHRHDFGTPNINTTELGNLIIPLPHLKIQEKIVDKIKDFESKIKNEKEKCIDNKRVRSEIITEFLIGEKNYQDVLEKLK